MIYQHCHKWVSSYITMETYRATYREVVFHVSVLVEYKQLDEVVVVLTLLMNKLQVRNPWSHNHVPSKGEGLIQQKWSRCLRIGHTSRNYDARFPIDSTKIESSSVTSVKTKVKSKSRYNVKAYCWPKLPFVMFVSNLKILKFLKKIVVQSNKLVLLHHRKEIISNIQKHHNLKGR